MSSTWFAALEQLKEQGVWCIGLDERGSMNYDEFDYSSDCLLVLGREGAGLHDLVKRTCDHLLRIPMAGKVASLNVSAAAAVVLYEAARQRRASSPGNGVAPKTSTKKQKGLGMISRGPLLRCASLSVLWIAVWADELWELPLPSSPLPRHLRRLSRPPNPRSPRLRTAR